MVQMARKPSKAALDVVNNSGFISNECGYMQSVSIETSIERISIHVSMYLTSREFWTMQNREADLYTCQSKTILCWKTN